MNYNSNTEWYFSNLTYILLLILHPSSKNTCMQLISFISCMFMIHYIFFIESLCQKLLKAFDFRLFFVMNFLLLRPGFNLNNETMNQPKTMFIFFSSWGTFFNFKPDNLIGIVTIISNLIEHQIKLYSCKGISIKNKNKAERKKNFKKELTFRAFPEVRNFVDK